MSNDNQDLNFLSRIRQRMQERQQATQELNQQTADLMSSLQKTIENHSQQIKDLDTGSRIEKKEKPVSIADLLAKAESQGKAPVSSTNKIEQNNSSEEVSKENDEETKMKTSTSEGEEKKFFQKQNGKKLLDRKKIRELENVLKTSVFGQDEVIHEISNTLKVATLNMKTKKHQPAGRYLCAGPTGVGKTEAARKLSEFLDVPLLKIDCGQYGLEQDVTKLIGVAPGYVGHKDGGILTNFVAQNPACVILLDEFEKAHPTIDKILLSILDDGECTDSKVPEANEDRTIRFGQVIVMISSNLGAELEYIQGLDEETNKAYRMESIKKGLRPEILNRLDSTFQFKSLSLDVYKKVFTKLFGSIQKVVKEEVAPSMGVDEINLNISDKLLDFVVKESYDPAMGGRPAERFMKKVLLVSVADFFLSEAAESELKNNKDFTLDLNAKGQICFKGKNNKVLEVLDNTVELMNSIKEGKFSKTKEEEQKVETEVPQIIPDKKPASRKRKMS